MDFRLNEHGMSLSGSSMDVNLKQRAQVISELSEKQKELQESLRRKLVELRKLCLQEAELTGHVPDDFPLEYGERPPVVSRRPKATFRVNAATVTRAEELQLERLERDFVVQLQMAEAARKLSLAAEQNVEMNSEQRRKRRLVYLDALQRLQELEEQSNNLRRKLGLRPVHRDPSNLIDEAHPSENSSLSESSSYEDILGQGARPSPPRISEHSHNVSNSPERRMGWKSSPVVLHSDVHNRRNSMASAASPTRSFPRSLSSLEGRSVPATPILSRNSCSSSALRSEGPGLSQRQWSGSQDSQVGFPSDRPSGHAARSRRSNSSEALIERPPPSEGPAKPSFNSSETLSENPQSGTVPPQQRGARSLDTRTPSNSRLSYEEILLDYYMERQQPRGWTEPEGQWFAEPDGSGHYSRRDGFPGSPAIRSRFEMQQQRRNAARTKSCGPQLADVGSFPQSWHHESFPQRPPPQASYPGPRSRSQPRAPPPETLERSVHKALALEGLRDWYLRNSAATSALHRCPVSSQMPNQRYYRPPYTDGHYQAASPLSHSISFTGAPMHGRHLSEYLGQEWCSQANIQGDGASEGTPPGTLV
ncbi:coiled-coil domain-containing protein 120 isoform X2 [Xenopus laevis]|uniref:Coiled-coil domain-containing protein 120 isoform X2 n=1 Tax=Xenopus laevis TaxID=8355 RepID=A0A8J0TLK9_XENLA|nr:coiled-coil domain-containing protein 120 isoform X2 [Xenopus laevis]